MRKIIIVGGLLLAACSRPAPAPDSANSMSSAGSVDTATGNAPTPLAEANTAAPAASPTATASDADYLGRWIGVEGMFLNVTRRTGGVKLEMQWDLDHKGIFDGTVTDKGIEFTRDGKTETLVPSDGDATGLKYLAGKKHCLTVKSGEGYCRD